MNSPTSNKSLSPSPNDCRHDYENAINTRRATWHCPLCGEDISVGYVMYRQSLELNQFQKEVVKAGKVQRDLNREMKAQPNPYPAPNLQQHPDIKLIRFMEFPGTTVTICLLTTHNNVYIVGYSACTNVELYNPVKGQEIAYMDAIFNYENLKAQSMYG